jgi:hypothetical protein
MRDSAREYRPNQHALYVSVRTADSLMVKAAVEEHGQQGNARAGPACHEDDDHLPEHPRHDAVPAPAPELAGPIDQYSLKS